MINYNDLYKHHHKTLEYWSHKFWKADFTKEEIKSDINLSFMLAAHSFDSSKGSFSTYLPLKIQSHLMDQSLYHWKHLSNRSTKNVNNVAYSGQEQEMMDKILATQVLSKLTKRDKKILYSRYWLDKSFKEIGEELGVSVQRAHELHDRIISKLQHTYGEKVYA